ncbi:MAG: phosphoribosylformylglycinamidine cyclo-ligase [Cyanobacteriota bacterium]|nr:phosphoribosylformylglycinamidine cyclo-ligase [Cyanobacteriota bacterium]
MDYRSSGVDVAAGRAFVDRIRASVESTRRQEVMGTLGGFGGLFRLPEGMRDPVLVAGTDGVGTKLELALSYDRHHSVGIDLVAMCVNDVITSGADPLFFLDYIATGRLSPDSLARVVEGIADGCRQSGCALLGGETAEMPGFYAPGHYDLAGFCVAAVEASRLIDGSSVRPGDRVLAVASNGAHSNGYSLIRRIVQSQNVDSHTLLPRGEGTLIDALLAPTRLYGALVKTFRQAGLPLAAMAHITGGGLPENLPRCLPEGVHAQLDPSSWERPPLFRWLQEAGDVPEADLWNTFNLGVGFCVVVPHTSTREACELARSAGHHCWELGEICRGPAPVGQALAGLPVG